MNTVIFLGAGASRTDGAPLQSDLFKDYFECIKKQSQLTNSHMERELATFFDLMFNIDVDGGSLEMINFPTFEEVLGILDLAESRNESFREYDLDNIASNCNRLRQIRMFLIMLMAKAIKEKVQNNTGRGYHEVLVNKIYEIKGSNTSDISFISTNYDILIDNALAGYASANPRGGENIDYGLEFTNFTRENDWCRPGNHAVKLYKIHGSLNWLYCSVCNTITITPYQKGAANLIADYTKLPCRECESVLLPIIVPPTYFKDMTNIFLSQVWALAEQSLRKCNHVIFCGYSFPDADLHLKYLLKRIQTGRKGNSVLKYSVINNFMGKEENTRKEENNRYRRFLGRDVDYTDLSFEEFAENPGKIII